MAGNIIIGLRFFAQTGSAIRNMSQYSSALGFASKMSFRMQRRLAATNKQLAISSGMVLGIASSLMKMTSAYSSFSLETTRAGLIAGKSGGGLAKMRSILMDMDDLEFDPTELAKGMAEVYRAGIRGAEALNTFRAAADMATFAGMSLREAVKRTSILFRAWSDTGLNAAEINDRITKASQLTTTDIQGLGDAFGYVTGPAIAANQSFADTLTILSLVVPITAQASKAGTAVRAMYSKLITPKDIKLLKEMNVSLVDQWGSMRNLSEVTLDIIKKTRGWNDQQRATLASQIFGIRGVQAFAAIMKTLTAGQKVQGKGLLKGRELLKHYNQEWENSNGLSANAAKKLRVTFPLAMERFSNTMKRFTIIALEPFAHIVSTITDSLKPFIDGLKWLFDNVPAFKAIVGYGLPLLGIAGATAFIPGAINTLKNKIVSLSAASTTASVVGAGVGGVAASAGVFSMAKASMVGIGAGILSGMKNVALGFASFLSNVLTSPFFLLTSAVIAIGSAFSSLTKSVEALRDEEDKKLAKVGTTIDKVFDALTEYQLTGGFITRKIYKDLERRGITRIFTRYLDAWTESQLTLDKFFEVTVIKPRLKALEDQANSRSPGQPRMSLKAMGNLGVGGTIVTFIKDALTDISWQFRDTGRIEYLRSVGKRAKALRLELLKKQRGIPAILPLSKQPILSGRVVPLGAAPIRDRDNLAFLIDGLKAAGLGKVTINNHLENGEIRTTTVDSKTGNSKNLPIKVGVPR